MQQQQDLDDIKKITKKTMVPIEEETNQKIEEDKDTISKDASDKLHRNLRMTLPNKVEV